MKQENTQIVKFLEMPSARNEPIDFNSLVSGDHKDTIKLNVVTEKDINPHFSLDNVLGGKKHSYKSVSLGMFPVEYDGAAGPHGNVKTDSTEKAQFRILPPDTKFSITIALKSSEQLKKHCEKNLGIYVEEYIKTTTDNLIEFIEQAKDALWKYHSSLQKNIEQIIKKGQADAMKAKTKYSETVAFENAKEEFCKKIAVPYTESIEDGVLVTRVKFEKRCYVDLSGEFKEKFESGEWKNYFLENPLDANKPQYLGWFIPSASEKNKGLTEPLSKRIYDPYTVRVPFTVEYSQKIKEDMLGCGLTETECLEKLRSIERFSNVQINARDTLYKKTGDLKHLSLLSNQVKKGDIVELTFKPNMYTSPEYGIRFFFDTVTIYGSNATSKATVNLTTSNRFAIYDDSQDPHQNFVIDNIEDNDVMVFNVQNKTREVIQQQEGNNEKGDKNEEEVTEPLEDKAHTLKKKRAAERDEEDQEETPEEDTKKRKTYKTSDGVNGGTEETDDQIQEEEGEVNDDPNSSYD